MKEYPTPPGSNPYDAFADKNGELWEGSMWTDRIVRLNPKTNVLTSVSVAASDQHPPRVCR